RGDRCPVRRWLRIFPRTPPEAKRSCKEEVVLGTAFGDREQEIGDTCFKPQLLPRSTECRMTGRLTLTNGSSRCAVANSPRLHLPKEDDPIAVEEDDQVSSRRELLHLPDRSRSHRRRCKRTLR